MKRYVSVIKDFTIRCLSGLERGGRSFLHGVGRCCLAWCLYTGCRELSLWCFIDCLCDGKLKVLRKHGIGCRYLETLAWTGIMEEYAWLSGDSGYERGFLLSKEIARDNGKLAMVKFCLQVLSAKYSRKCAESLYLLGYEYRFDPADRPGYRKDLERVGRKVRMLGVELENKRKQYGQLLSGKGKRPRREEFTRSLALLSRYMGYRIDPGKVTVEEYVTMQKQYEKEMQSAVKAGKAGKY